MLTADRKLTKRKIDTVQVNLGNRCNQACTHCHVAASPSGKQNMEGVTAEKLLENLAESKIGNIEFTGGAPEMNPHLPLLIEGLAQAGKQVTVRTNLTVLAMPEYSFYRDLYQKHRVHLIASLPSVFEYSTDEQRGKGTFSKSVEVIRQLNDAGYGTNGLSLDLVYNPAGDYLPPPEMQVESEYRQILDEQYGVKFNKLYTMANVPLARFKKRLEKEGSYTKYLDLLKQHFNPSTLEQVMCRDILTIDYQGNVYDCDFNLADKRRIKGYEEKKFWEIDLDTFHAEVSLAEYCYACTADSGSSCHGSLVKEKGKTALPDQDRKRTPAQAGADFDVKESVKQYYGEELTQTGDLKTSACCTIDAIPAQVKAALPLIHDEIKMKYYGCGNTIPEYIQGLSILDMGCGTGRDSYVMAYLAGEQGFVYGIDMTESQIRVAQRYVGEQAARFGYARPNAKFIHDEMENLHKHLTPASIDLVTSNCVINLVEDKEQVLKEIYRVLKNGGEFYFSDVYADRRVPEEVRKNRILYGECLGGALYKNDFERIVRSIGFIDPRVVSQQVIDIQNEDIKALAGNITFTSVTYRLWKLDGLEEACEDYGHVAVYKGGIPESPFTLRLDDGHVFERNKPVRVCGNTALMLSKTRLRDFFHVTGSFDEHFGLFKDCGTAAGEPPKADPGGGPCC